MRSAFLREFSIPEPVTGGLLFSVLIALFYVISGIEVEFDLAARDVLLVYFFTTIGINASLRDLLAGGKPLVILLAITITYMFLQNLTGISVAALFDLPAAVGMLGGSVSLIGGHGTAIAWAPRIAEDYGIANAMEIGIACATFGLILASIMGGPIAKFLITRHDLTPTTGRTAGCRCLRKAAKRPASTTSTSWMPFLPSTSAPFSAFCSTRHWKAWD